MEVGESCSQAETLVAREWSASASSQAPDSQAESPSQAEGSAVASPVKRQKTESSLGAESCAVASPVKRQKIEPECAAHVSPIKIEPAATATEIVSSPEMAAGSLDDDLSLSFADQAWVDLPDLGELFGADFLKDLDMEDVFAASAPIIEPVAPATVCQPEQPAPVSEPEASAPVSEPASLFVNPDLEAARRVAPLPAGHHGISKQAKGQAFAKKAGHHGTSKKSEGQAKAKTNIKRTPGNSKKHEPRAAQPSQQASSSAEPAKKPTREVKMAPLSALVQLLFSRSTLRETKKH